MKFAVIAMVFALLACAAVCMPPAAPAEQAAAPSVVLIVVDDLGKTELGSMPNLTAWASANALRFSHCYGWPTCSPTRAAYRLGRYPRTQATIGGAGGIGDLPFNAYNPGGGERLPLEAVTIFEAFQATHDTRLVGKWHLGRAPLPSSMNRVASGPEWQGVGLWTAGSAVVLPNGPSAQGYYQWQRVDGGDIDISTQYATDAQREAFLEVWSAPRLRPLFVELSWSAIHSPYEDPPGYSTSTARETADAMAAYLDQQLELVLDQIDLDTTYVFICSDNGTNDGARQAGMPSGFWKGSPYQGGINTPLYVAGPTVGAGETDRMVSMVDLPATMLELAGTPQPAGAFPHSVSFADALGPFNGAPERAFCFSERYEVATNATPHPIGYDCQTIIEAPTTIGGAPVRLKRIIQDADGNGPGGVTDEVFNLLLYPHEDYGVPFSSMPLAVRNRLDAELASIPARL